MSFWKGLLPRHALPSNLEILLDLSLQFLARLKQRDNLRLDLNRPLRLGVDSAARLTRPHVELPESNEFDLLSLPQGILDEV